MQDALFSKKCLISPLRLTQEVDLDFVISAEQAVENRPFITQWTRNQHQMALRNPDLKHLMLEGADHSYPVGYCILQGLQNPNQSIQLRRLVITEKGQGYGRAALHLLKAIAFEELNVHRLWLDVKDFNQRAIHLYTTEGFVIEGTLRDCEKVGDRYESLIVMSILEAEYQN